MGMANLRALLCRRFALFAIPAEHLAPPVIAVPRLKHPAGFLSVFRAVGAFYHSAFNSGDYQFWQFWQSTPPLPHGLNYDSKGFIAFDPRDFALNRVPIARSRVKSAGLFAFSS